MPENREGPFSSMRGRRFDTEAEARADNHIFLAEKLAREQQVDQEITDATTATGNQVGCLVILLLVGFIFPPLWLICLGMGYWVMRKVR